MEVVEIALGLAEFLQRDPPRRAFEDHGHCYHHVVDGRIGDRILFENLLDALVERHAGAEREHQQSDNEAPEIKFTTEAQRMAFIGRAAGTAMAVQQQALIAGVDQRMDALAQHHRTAGPERRGELGDGDQEVAGQRCIDNGFG